ncbi:ESX secretion-associated protein EspG [Amycolatopsis benzoatilytica]|uniref:ESX secretion-associated protein EspG n=1 Tax=Amycolatopsis benzoatilytica TaxID=346045 RepID=UPI000368C0F4|nr:ESX secretion-associated protein EspG [Amycolatopsis benzoatilytica]
MADRFEFVLDVVEALVIGEATGGNIRQFPLRIGSLPSDPARFVQVAKKVNDSVEERRLSVGDDLRPSVRTAFELLAKPRVSVAVSGVDGLGADIAVLALTDGRQALGITQDPKTDQLLFSLFADEELVEVVAGVLPRARPASTGAATVRQAASQEVSAMTARRRAEAAEDEEETDAFGMIEVSGRVEARRPDPRVSRAPAGGVEVLERVLAQPRLGGGQISVTGWGRHGERRGGTPLGWLDTADGRYLIKSEVSPAGDLTADYLPAGHRDLARAVQQAISAVY